MNEELIGAIVINKANERGKIVSVDEKNFSVEFDNRIARFEFFAFEKGFLKFENEELISIINNIIENINNNVVNNHRTLQKVASNRKVASSSSRKANNYNDLKPSSVIFENKKCCRIRLEPAPISFNLVKNKHKELIKRIFDECDKDTGELYKSFDPVMKYPKKYTSYSKSKYSIGFVTKYIDNYVFRVFARHDAYKQLIKTGLTILDSDITEIFRILYIDGSYYYFTKNFTLKNGYYILSDYYKNWHISNCYNSFILNKIESRCDCGYLNNYISEKNMIISHYAKLLFPALLNNKVEIIFKNKQFDSTYHIKDIVKFVESYSHKQIDYASKNHVINALPFIKSYSPIDMSVLRNLDLLLENSAHSSSVYNRLKEILLSLEININDLDKRIIQFLKKIDYFDVYIYNDYIRLLKELPAITINDFFDKDYIDRHDELIATVRNNDDKLYDEDYIKAAKKLSWIDRYDNGYYIIVPKTINDFMYEAQIQHNCVYSLKYYVKVIKNESIIVFLRINENEPYVTIEFSYNTFKVLQAYGKYNMMIDSELYQYIKELGRQLYLEKIDI